MLPQFVQTNDFVTPREQTRAGVHIDGKPGGVWGLAAG